ncbi:MAG: MopE-related protein, partial [Myxococcota bacterium]
MNPRPLVVVWCLASAGCLWISADEHTQRKDQDLDGVGFDVDCDDFDPRVAPGLAEQPCDALDNDCDPATLDGPAVVGSTVYASVQAAVDAAPVDGTITVCPGFHAGVTIVTPGLAVSGTGDPALTTVSGGGTGPAFTIAAPGVTISRLTVAGGTGVARAEAPGLPEGTYGGGVYAMDATDTVTLSNLIVQGNTADHGAGIAGPLVGALAMSGVVVRQNTATGRGGGLLVPSAATVTAGSFTQNAADEGGGIAVLTGGVLDLADQVGVTANIAARGGGGSLGAGASWTGGGITENVADEAGGGLWSLGGAASDVVLRLNTSLVGGNYGGYGVLARAEVSDGKAEGGGGVW